MSFVLAVSGSPAPISKSARLADHVCDALGRSGHRSRHIKVRDLPAHALLGGDAGDPAIARAVGLLEEADGVVFVTPTYKASYSGLLKVFLDLLPQFGLTGKTVLPLAVGGSAAHVMMLDYALRPVLQSLGARHVVQGHFALESALDLAAPELICDARCEAMLASVVAEFAEALPRRALATA